MNNIRITLIIDADPGAQPQVSVQQKAPDRAPRDLETAGQTCRIGVGQSFTPSGEAIAVELVEETDLLGTRYTVKTTFEHSAGNTRHKITFNDPFEFMEWATAVQRLAEEADVLRLIGVKPID